MARRKTRFAARLKRKARDLRLTQAALARRLGVTESAVSMVLLERRKPSMAFAQLVIRHWPEFAEHLAHDLKASGRAVPAAAVSLAQGGGE